jgi:hypothetical protein
MFSDGMQIPAGTTTNVTAAIGDYFFTAVLSTVFQPQVIKVLVILAACLVMYFVIKWLKYGLQAENMKKYYNKRYGQHN